MALLPGSPAIGAGTPISGITTDQRGFARPASNPDIGAFQTQGSTLVVNTTADGTVSGPGQLTLRQAVDIDNMLSTAEPITFSSLFNTPQTITLTGGPARAEQHQRDGGDRRPGGKPADGQRRRHTRGLPG